MRPLRRRPRSTFQRGSGAFGWRSATLLAAVPPEHRLVDLHENDGCLQVAWGPLTLIAFVGTAHASDVRAVWRNDRDIIDRHGTLSSITVMLGELQMSAPDEVKKLAAEMTADLAPHSVCGAVVVPWEGLPGAFFRALLAGIYLLGRVRTPNRVFAELRSALDWVISIPGQVPAIAGAKAPIHDALAARLGQFEARTLGGLPRV